MNSQYRKNLKDLAVACKEYTDKVICINYFNPNASDVTLNGYYTSDNHYVPSNSFNETGYIPCKAGDKIRPSYIMDGSHYYSQTVFYNANKEYITGIGAEQQTPYLIVPNNEEIAYVRIPVTKIDWNKNTSILLNGLRPNRKMEYGVAYLYDSETKEILNFDISFNNSEIERIINGLANKTALTPYATMQGVMQDDGTVNTGFSSTIKKYKIVSDYSNGKYYLTGYSTLSVGSQYHWVMALIFDSNGNKIGFVKPKTNPQTYDLYELEISNNASEIWVHGATSELYINEYGTDNLNHWSGKTWYAYGTSITNINNEGKYPTYLAQLSGMKLVNKGISGGGIGNLGAYSQGQVYNAICNTTDGKTDADLITLECGANDCSADVPLGTIYDTGTSTLCGCFNDCIRYLQANTTAQIVVIPSVATKTEPTASNKYYEFQLLMKQMCFINRVEFIDGNDCLGYGRINGNTTYTSDSIHQTNLGGYNLAKSIWAKLKDVPLFYTSIPD